MPGNVLGNKGAFCAIDTITHRALIGFQKHGAGTTLIRLIKTLEKDAG